MERSHPGGTAFWITVTQSVESEFTKVAGKGQQQYYWTEAVQVTNTDDRPDLSSEGAPDIDKTVNVKQKWISGHEPQMRLDTKTD
jgi:hypothetical protein